MNALNRILLIASLLAAGPNAQAASVTRTMNFLTVGARDCYISLYNFSNYTQTVNWSILGGDGFSSYSFFAVARLFVDPDQAVNTPVSLAGGPISVGPGESWILVLNKDSNHLGTLAGYLVVTDPLGGTPPLVASGYCTSGARNEHIPFTIGGGRPF